MLKFFSKCVTFCLWAVFFIHLFAPKETVAAGFQVRESQSERIILEWNLPEVNWREWMVDGRKYLIPEIEQAVVHYQAGHPMLPAFVYTLPLPTNQTAHIVLRDSVFVVTSLSTAICPKPRFQYIENERGQYLYEEDPSIYQNDIFTPLPVVEHDIQTMAGKQDLKIVLFPIQYNAARNTIRQLHFARLEIRLVPTSALPKVLSKGMTSSLWLQPENSYVKLFLLHEGVYGVTGSDLQSLGVSLLDIDPRTLKILHMNTEIPIVVTGEIDGRFDTEDQVRFYANRRQGDGEYYHTYSDTNVYWLTWGGNKGARLPIAELSKVEGTADTFWDTLHLEKDLYYYAGDTDIEIHNTQRSLGEGWVWSVINRGANYSFNFDLPAIAADEDSVGIRLRLRGTTWDPHTPDHHVRIYVNDKEAVDFYFNDREEKILHFNLPPSGVQEYNNRMEIRSLADTPAERSQFYLDWMEVDYHRWTRAADGWLSFTISDENQGQYFINGFGSDRVAAWDLTTMKTLSVQPSGRSWCAHITVTSAGYLDGERASFEVNGNVVAIGYRGHNLLRLDPKTGAILEQTNYDTYGSSARADSMAAYIHRLPDSALVLIAIRDEGSVAMTEAAHLAMESLGSSLTRQVGVRDSYVLFGRKGAPPGSVPELLKKSRTGPAVLSQTLVFREGGSSLSALVNVPTIAGSKVVVFDSSGIKKPLRIKRYHSAGLHNTQQGADYIIITHPLFLQQANRLAAYRAQTNGLRSKVVLVEEIYDEFNFGLADPIAIRSFLQFAYQNWLKPEPKYVLFFGDASWDAKGLTYNTTEKDYVPTYGNPASDSWFACLDGDNDMLPDLYVGRLPVTSPAQAESCIEKIVAYENTPSAEWKKDFVFISGGFDYIEQMQFRQQSQQLVNEFIDSDPTFGRAVMLHKTTQGLAEGEHRHAILEAINNGAVWVNFIGHAGSRTWDLMFHNADITALQNAPRYPFITSMTCHTGRFAEPNQVSFGEQFILTAEKGAIGFLGSSGWGYSFEDYAFLRQLYPRALKDTLRSLGEIVTKSKWGLWRSASSNPQVRDMVYQYNLLGDPALALATPTQPDLTIKHTGILVTPEVPSEADSLAQVKVIVNNFGLATRDSSEVLLTAIHPTLGRVEIGRQRMGVIGRIDSSQFVWPLRNMAGSMELEAVADAGDVVAEVDETNNQRLVNVNVLFTRIQLVAPPLDALVPYDRVVLKIMNPQKAGERERLFVFSVDTSLAFNSPLLQNSEPMAAQSIIVSWRPQNLLPDQVYYWRAVDLSEAVNEFKSVGIFKTSEEEYGWQQEMDEIFRKNENSNIDINQGVKLRQNKYQLYIDSAGFFDGSFVLLLVNGKQVLNNHRGHNLAIIDRNTGTVLYAKSFDTFADTTQSNDMADVIFAVEDSQYVMIGIMDEGSASMTERAYKALESIGSQFCRKVGFRYSWSIIGKKGAKIGSVPEAIKAPRSGTAVVSHNIYFYSREGKILSPFIVANKWYNFSCNYEIQNNTNIKFNIFGKRRNTNQIDTLFHSLNLFKSISIESIDPKIYPLIKISAVLSTNNAQLSPTLNNWTLTFDPVPDLAVSQDYFTLSADTVLSGTTVLIKLRLFNIGMAPAENLKVKFMEIDPRGNEKLIASIFLPRPLPPDGSIDIDQVYTPTGSFGMRQVMIIVDPEDDIAELNEANNVLTGRLFIRADSEPPSLRLLFDDREIASGDLVAQTPCIRALIYDDSPKAIDDTLSVRLYLDGQRVYFAGSEANLQFGNAGYRGARGQVLFTPQLQAGFHYLEFSYVDDTGNRSTIQAEFRVETELKLLRVMNYPNPFQKHTDFTFELTQPAEVQIKIFTVAGRLIRTIDAGWMGAGFNRIFWNGSDQDGDDLANGVYLYKITATNPTGQAIVLEKVIVMR